MAAEPSAFGAKVHFHPDRPPSIEPVVSDLTFQYEGKRSGSFWADVKPADPRFVYTRCWTTGCRPRGWVYGWSVPGGR